jgi:hypothetical protein
MKKRLFNFFRRNKVEIEQQPQEQEQQKELTEEEQIKNCLFKFWEHCQNGGYRIQGFKDGILMPDVITFEIIRN